MNELLNYYKNQFDKNNKFESVLVCFEKHVYCLGLSISNIKNVPEILQETYMGMINICTFQENLWNIQGFLNKN